MTVWAVGRKIWIDCSCDICQNFVFYAILVPETHSHDAREGRRREEAAHRSSLRQLQEKETEGPLQTDATDIRPQAHELNPTMPLHHFIVISDLC